MTAGRRRKQQEPTPKLRDADREATITEIDPRELAASLEPPSPTGSRLYLVMSQEDASVRVIDLAEGEEVTFGRASDTTFPIDNPRVSRRHARIARRGGQIVITDLGSRNGTKVNGETLRKGERVARNGDIARIGPAEVIIAVVTRWGTGTEDDAEPPSER